MIKKPYMLEKQVGFMLRLAGQRHSGIFQTHAPLGLTPTQFSVLIKVLELGECSQNELGRKTAMDVATIKGVVDRLRSRDLVFVKPDPSDKRRALVVPTERTKAMAGDLKDAGHQITKDTLAPLSASEREAFLALLAKIS
jgi:DNA-binding MarR family transcriptional regulator